MEAVDILPEFSVMQRRGLVSIAEDDYRFVMSGLIDTRVLRKDSCFTVCIVEVKLILITPNIKLCQPFEIEVVFKSFTYDTYPVPVYSFLR